MSLELPALLRIQAGTVRRHAPILADVCARLELGNWILTPEQMAAVRSALIFALGVLVEHDGIRPVPGDEP